MRSSRRHLRFESLENRAVLSADLVGGVLTVTGTDRNDIIQVAIPNTGLHAGELQVDVNGAQRFFQARNVDAIHIFALGGNDRITIDDDVSIDVVISGGDGRDTIKGGSGSDTIHGDGGNDSVQGSAGRDTLYGDLGNDVLDGGDGDDYVDGGDGNDDCRGGLGDDRVKGGNGNDRLDGGQGNNLLDGDTGNDKKARGVSVDLDREFTATFDGIGNLLGTASFEWKNDGGRASALFDVRVEHLAPNARLNVIIDGVIVGRVVTNSLARVNRSSPATRPAVNGPFPAAFRQFTSIQR